ncbi:CMRF35-like molecule 5 isoform X1, partial [Arapaima gigas]
INLIVYGLFPGAHCKDIGCPGKLYVQEHGNLTMICSYDVSYKEHNKYWCKGSSFLQCTVLNDTKQTVSSTTNPWISISDIKKKTAFYIPMNNVRQEDKGRYWCDVSVIFTDKNCPVDITMKKGKNPNSSVNVL